MAVVAMPLRLAVAVSKLAAVDSDPVLRTGQIVFALTQRLDANSHFTQDCSDGIWPDWLACPKNDGIGAVILQEEIHFLTKTR